MANQMNFRTALNGFNREDVVRYIDFLNTKHAADLTQLNSELEYLRNCQKQRPTFAPEQDETIAQQAARIRELFDRCTALEQELAAAKAEKEAPAQQPVYQSRVDEELEAYRRAERTERLARERAENLYLQVNSALTDATAKVDEAAQQVGQISERVATQLAELQEAVSNSKHALRDATATMYTIRPNID